MEKEKLKTDRKNMNMDPDNMLYFFKIIYDGLTDEHLKIPPEFVKHISKEVSDRVILQGPSGSYWPVKLRKKSSRIYLEDGWKQFMSDHSLGNNEFLLFGYDGNMSFNVQIFDKNGCERTIAHVTDSNQDFDFSEENLKRGKPRKKPVETDAKAHNYGSDSDQDFEFSEENLKRGKPRKKPVETQHVKAHKYDTSNNFLRRQHLTQDESTKNVEAAEFFTSEFPHFMVCLKKSSTETGCIQHVPTRFAKANLPPCTFNITIQNSLGKAWEVSCLYNGSRYCFSGGWGTFVRDNKLKKGDVCVFELIDRDKMQVNIFRSS